MTSNPSDKIILEHENGRVMIQPGLEKNQVHIEMANKNDFVSGTSDFATAYPVELIEKVLAIKGPAYLCDEISRDENPNYVKVELLADLLGYIPEEAFADKRILDFGCGSGASTVILSQTFPSANILGIDISDKLLSLAQSRQAFYQLRNVEFLRSENGAGLPAGLGSFDYIVLNAVYEHLLPEERQTIIAELWRALRPQGILFINETPYRYWLKEFHTTGLYGINYLPRHLAHWAATKYSKRIAPTVSWSWLLRNGIRGGSAGELLRLIKQTGTGKPVVLEPSRLGLQDRIDLWGYILETRKLHTAKTRKIQRIAKRLKRLTGLTVLPTFAIAIQKQ